MDEEKLKKIKCLLFDLDGTLLTSDKRITPRSAEILNRAKDKGYRIGFSTGRSLSALGAFTYPVGLLTDVPSIGCAGGEISLVLHDKPQRLYVRPFPLDVLEDLLTFALNNGLNFSLDGVGPRYYSAGLSYISTYYKDRDRAQSMGLDYPELIPVHGISEVPLTLDGTVVKPMIWYEHREQLKCMDDWNSRHPGYTNMASGFDLVEVLPDSVNKAAALERMCYMSDLLPEECCVFGDSENDLPILRRAGVSVAMCNGFREAVREADIVTDFGNDEDGAADMVEKLFL